MLPILTHSRKPDITFYNNGRIEVSRRLARILGIRKGDVLNLMQENNRHYLYLSSLAVWSNGSHEAACSPSAPGSRHFRAHSVALARAAARVAAAEGCAKVGAYAGDPMLSEIYGVYVPLFLLNARIHI